eukprot:scaffold59444_cov75-Attheya_sp.AAC.1
MLLKLHASVGAVAWGEEPQAGGGVLVEEDENKVIWRNTERMGTSGSSGGNNKRKGGNIIHMEPEDVGRLRLSTSGPTIVSCTLQKVKSFHGSNNKTKEKAKEIDRNINNSDAPTLSTAKVGCAISVNARWASFYAMHVS